MVVLDTAWTPAAGDRRDIIAVRQALGPVLGRIDLFVDAQERLDAWAEAVEAPDRLMRGGVSWWFRIRPNLAYWLHERLLWVHALAELGVGRSVGEVVVPADEPALAGVAGILAAAGTCRVEVLPAEATTTPATGPSEGGPPAAGRWRAWIGRRLRRRELSRRARVLDERIALAARAERRLLVVAQQGPAAGRRVGLDAPRMEPQLEAVVDRLTADGLRPTVLALELDHLDDAHWPDVQADDRLLPRSLLRTRWSAGSIPSESHADVDLAALRSQALDVDGLDLGPILVDEIASLCGRWLTGQLVEVERIGRLLAELQPAAMLLSHEGVRATWLAAARRRGIPSYAIQHGVIYATHPFYEHVRHAGLILPDCTFVFGEWERQVLLDVGHFGDAEVAVSGAPRAPDDGIDVEPDRGSPEALALRRTLGVADGDRLLVVSTASVPIVRRFHIVDMLERVLDGPLPGVHVVFKLHPGETDDGPYTKTLAGLARVGGYEAPRMSVVRDVDLYALLRVADAHLSLHSTVLSDAVICGTPNLLAIGQAYRAPLDYVADGVAEPVADVAAVRAALADPRPPDPAARRAFIDDHFRPGDASGRIEAALEAVLRSEAANGPARAARARESTVGQ